MRLLSLLVAASLQLSAALAVPTANPQGMTNQFWSWRGQQIRYQALGDPDAKQSVLMVHGLFVNADHWQAAGCRRGQEFRGGCFPPVLVGLRS